MINIAVLWVEHLRVWLTLVAEIAPSVERDQLNVSLLSSVPESELGTNASKDLGHPLTDFRARFSIWWRNYPAKVRQVYFFDK